MPSRLRASRPVEGCEHSHPSRQAGQIRPWSAPSRGVSTVSAGTTVSPSHRQDTQSLPQVQSPDSSWIMSLTHTSGDWHGQVWTPCTEGRLVPRGPVLSVCHYRWPERPLASLRDCHPHGELPGCWEGDLLSSQWCGLVAVTCSDRALRIEGQLDWAHVPWPPDGRGERR